jgi:hypothetical protein
VNRPEEAPTPLLSPEPAVAFDETSFPNYAVINATLRKGHDYVALVFLSEPYGVPENAPEYWQLFRMRGSDTRRTIELAPDFFFRARLSGKQFGIYVDMEGRINCMPERMFNRELDRRFRDCVMAVNLTWDESDWAGDRFSKQVPQEHIGEAPFTLP